MSRLLSKREEPTSASLSPEPDFNESILLNQWQDSDYSLGTLSSKLCEPENLPQQIRDFETCEIEFVEPDQLFLEERRVEYPEELRSMLGDLRHHNLPHRLQLNFESEESAFCYLTLTALNRILFWNLDCPSQLFIHESAHPINHFVALDFGRVLIISGGECLIFLLSWTSGLRPSPFRLPLSSTKKVAFLPTWRAIASFDGFDAARIFDFGGAEKKIAGAPPRRSAALQRLAKVWRGDPPRRVELRGRGPLLAAAEVLNGEIWVNVYWLKKMEVELFRRFSISEVAARNQLKMKGELADLRVCEEGWMLDVLFEDGLMVAIELNTLLVVKGCVFRFFGNEPVVFERFAGKEEVLFSRGRRPYIGSLAFGASITNRNIDRVESSRFPSKHTSTINIVEMPRLAAAALPSGLAVSLSDGRVASLMVDAIEFLRPFSGASNLATLLRLPAEETRRFWPRPAESPTLLLRVLRAAAESPQPRLDFNTQLFDQLSSRPRPKVADSGLADRTLALLCLTDPAGALLAATRRMLPPNFASEALWPEFDRLTLHCSAPLAAQFARQAPRVQRFRRVLRYAMLKGETPEFRAEFAAEAAAGGRPTASIGSALAAFQGVDEFLSRLERLYSAASALKLTETVSLREEVPLMQLLFTKDGELFRQRVIFSPRAGPRLAELNLDPQELSLFNLLRRLEAGEKPLNSSILPQGEPFNLSSILKREPLNPSNPSAREPLNPSELRALSTLPFIVIEPYKEIFFNKGNFEDFAFIISRQADDYRAQLYIVSLFVSLLQTPKSRGLFTILRQKLFRQKEPTIEQRLESLSQKEKLSLLKKIIEGSLKEISEPVRRKLIEIIVRSENNELIDFVCRADLDPQELIDNKIETVRIVFDDLVRRRKFFELGAIVLRFYQKQLEGLGNLLNDLLLTEGVLTNEYVLPGVADPPRKVLLLKEIYRYACVAKAGIQDQTLITQLDHLLRVLQISKVNKECIESVIETIKKFPLERQANLKENLLTHFSLLKKLEDFLSPKELEKVMLFKSLLIEPKFLNEKRSPIEVIAYKGNFCYFDPSRNFEILLESKRSIDKIPLSEAEAFQILKDTKIAYPFNLNQILRTSIIEFFEYYDQKNLTEYIITELIEANAKSKVVEYILTQNLIEETDFHVYWFPTHILQSQNLPMIMRFMETILSLCEKQETFDEFRMSFQLHLMDWTLLCIELLMKKIKNRKNEVDKKAFSLLFARKETQIRVAVNRILGFGFKLYVNPLVNDRLDMTRRARNLDRLIKEINSNPSLLGLND